MKFSILLLRVIFSALPAVAQNPQGDQAKLPQIKLEDYTIIGLEKVILPRKERRTVFKEINLEWSQNTLIKLKESPRITFKSETKSDITLLHELPDIDASAEYGSFNTVGAKLRAKFTTGDVVPFVGVDFRNSDGHVDRADYTKTTINGGIEGQAWKNSVFQLVSDYRNGRQSLWSNLIPPDSTWETKMRLWHGDMGLVQKLGEQFSIFTEGHFQTLDFENRFNYTQSSLSIKAAGVFASNNTSAVVKGSLDHNTTERDLDHNNSSNAAFVWKTDHSLYSSMLRLSQKFRNLSLSAAIKAQHLEIGNNDGSKTYLYPDAGIAINANEIFSLFAKYQPGLEFQTMEQMLQAYPLADFGDYAPTKLKHKVIAGVNFKPSSILNFDISSTYSEFENYPIVYSSFVDSSMINPSTLNYLYPYWEYRYINNAKIWENSFRMVYKVYPRFLFEGWLTYRWNEINTVDEHNKAISGNEIPYLPLLSGTLKVDWYFLQDHKFQIQGEYVGNRFNDVSNSIKLKEHFLLDAMLQFIISKQFSLKFFGKNLLDQDYEVFHTYSAPGISGGAGIEIKL